MSALMLEKNMKTPKVRILSATVILICLIAGAFVIYGLRTDCANTSGYVNCSEAGDNLLHK
jgi:hypothetical protein